uniref:Ig-like receptor 4 n=1 Tax=Xenopus tropicalis TaxID=8364 RepID=A0A803JM56_XENTR
MKSLLSLSVAAVCCLLIVNKEAYGGLLQQPNLVLSTINGADKIMLGDSVHLDCETASQKVYTYSLRHADSNVTVEQSQSKFKLNNVQRNMSGTYTCRYCGAEECSEDSEEEYVYVWESYPAPSITVTPRRIVLPGSNITITCSTPYSNIILSLYKYNGLITELVKEENSITYHITNASNQHIGQYFCKFKTKPGGAVQMKSSESNPMMIRVEDIEKPSITCEPQPKENGKIRIYCAASNKGKYMWFQLLNDNHGIENETEGIKNNVTFLIEQSTRPKKSICMYRIRLGDDFADSRYSNLQIIPEVQESPVISKKSDPKHTDIVLVTCKAPKWHAGMSFQLLNKDKEIQEEKAGRDSDRMIFSINKTENTNINFICIYQVRMECGLVPSAYSIMIDLNAQDYSLGNIIRLCVCIVVVTVSAILIKKGFFQQTHGENELMDQNRVVEGDYQALQQQQQVEGEYQAVQQQQVQGDYQAVQREQVGEDYQVIQQERPPELPRYSVKYVSKTGETELV